MGSKTGLIKGIFTIISRGFLYVLLNVWNFPLLPSQPSHDQSSSDDGEVKESKSQPRHKRTKSRSLSPGEIKREKVGWFLQNKVVVLWNLLLME